MFTERVFELHNREQVVLQLSESLASKNIEYVAFDFDDSLIDTKAIFKAGILDTCGIILYGQYWSEANDEMRQNALDLKAHYEEVLKALRPSYGIRPAVMHLATDITARMIAKQSVDSPHYQAAMKRTSDIYQRDRIHPFDYAHQTIDMFKATNRPLLLVTHAETEWTYRKLAKSGLYGRFDHVICIPVDETKADQWVPRLHRVGVNLSSTLVVGGNLYADILPTIAHGAQAVWINNKAIDHTPDPGIQIAEHIFRTHILEVSHIGDVIPALINR